MNTGVCNGITVLELGAGSTAAAIAGMVFADAGARVIKIEPPEGDRLRTLNPSGFMVWNRGKESVVADLRTTVGQEEFRRLCAGADVVLEGFAAGTTAAWNIDATAMTALYPALIHCTISAFGATGPYANVKPRDALIGAKSGLWARGSFAHRSGPVLYPIQIASFGAAMQTVAGVAGALLVRDATGIGQRLEVTLYGGIDPADYFVSVISQLMRKRGETPTSDSRAAMGATRYGVLLMTRDGRLVQTSTVLPHQARALCEVAGIAVQLDDPKFARLPMFDSADDAQEFEDMLVAAFREKDLEHWMPGLLASSDIAFEVGGTSEDGSRHPQIVHNGDVISIEDPVHGEVREIGPIGRFAATPMTPTKSAPRLGEHAELPVQVVSTTAEAVAGTCGQFANGPFTGVTIVEFGYFYAMPYGLAMAAALGARVIKLEDLAGDPHRSSFGPEVASTKTMTGKESISVDLRTQEGRQIALRLLKKADVFVNGFRSGVAEKLGMAEAGLRARNPGLVIHHASGYGSSGPYAHRALYAQAAQAVGGSFGRQVGYWTDPQRSDGLSATEVQAIIFPRLNHVIDGDSNAALAVLAAVSLGILNQRRTGSGQRVETSMIGANALAYSDDFCLYNGKTPVPICDEDYFGTGPLQRIYECADQSWVCIDVVNDAEFARMCEGLGLLSLAADERFSTSAMRAANGEELIASLAAAFATHAADHWEDILMALDVGCVAANMGGLPVMTSFDPVLLETGLTVTYEHPLYGEMRSAAAPVRLSATPGRIAPPCRLGEHTRSILAELGYTPAEVDVLVANGVTKAPETDPAAV